LQIGGLVVLYSFMMFDGLLVGESRICFIKKNLDISGQALKKSASKSLFFGA